MIVKLSIVPQLNNLEKAVAAAHTFLKKNPTDPYLTKNMNYYKTLFDVEKYLIDHEEQPYEVRLLTLSSCSAVQIKPVLNQPLCCPDCFPAECDALQQWRLQQQCSKHGAGHHAVLWNIQRLLSRLRGFIWDLRVQRLLSHTGRWEEDSFSSVWFRLENNSLLFCSLSPPRFPQISTLMCWNVR